MFHGVKSNRGTGLLIGAHALGGVEQFKLETSCDNRVGLMTQDGNRYHLQAQQLLVVSIG